MRGMIRTGAGKPSARRPQARIPRLALPAWRSESNSKLTARAGWPSECAFRYSEIVRAPDGPLLGTSAQAPARNRPQGTPR